MATISQISDSIDLAKAYYSELISALISDLKNGVCNETLKEIKCLRRLIRALEWDIEIEEVDATTVKLYGFLLKGIATYTGSTLPVNPNVYIPGVTIVMDSPDSATDLERTENDLLETSLGSGIWYLPFRDDEGVSITDGRLPTAILVNGTGLVGWQIDTTVTPYRIYGFSDNSPQEIIVRLV